MALLHLTATYPGLVYAPKRWATHDGVMPYRLLWAYTQGLEVVGARARLGLAEGIALAMAGDGAADAAQRTLEEAYPG